MDDLGDFFAEWRDESHELAEALLTYVPGGGNSTDWMFEGDDTVG